MAERVPNLPTTFASVIASYLPYLMSDEVGPSGEASVIYGEHATLKANFRDL